MSSILNWAKICPSWRESLQIIGYSLILTISLSWRILLEPGAVSCLDWNISPHSLHIFNELKRSLFTWFYSSFLYGLGREQGQLFQLNFYGFLSFLGLFFKNEMLSKVFLFLVVFLSIYFFSLLFEYFKIPRGVYLIAIIWGLLTPFYINMVILGGLGHLLNIPFFILDFYLIERYVKEEEFHLLIFLVFSWVITPIFISIVMFFVLILRLFWERIIITKNFHKFILNFNRTICALLIFISLQLYWVLQLIYQFFSSGKFSNFSFSSQHFPAYSVLDLFSLSNFWSPVYENIIYNTLPIVKSYFIFLNVIIPAFSFFILLCFNLKNFKHSKELLFLIILLILTLIFAFLHSFYNFSEVIFYFYRDITSVYTIILIIEVILFAFSLREIYLRKKNAFKITFILLIPNIILFVYNGRFLDLRTISKERNYILADQWIAKNVQTDFKVLWLPTGTFYIESGLKDGSWCSDFWAVYSSVPGCISDINYRHTFNYKFGYEILKKLYTKNITGTDKLLKLSSIRYLIVRLNRENNQWALPFDRPEWSWKVRDVYESLKRLKFPICKQYAYVKIFKNKNILPHIYPSTSPAIVYENLNTMLDMLEKNSSDEFPLFIKKESLKKELANLNLSQRLPIITFRKINPTRYEVKVKNATSLFFLVFSESYHPKWKVYIETNNKQNNEKWEIITEYLKLHVKEARHDWYKFTPRDIKYLFKKPLPEKYHLLVNGYANAWYIDPQKIGNSNFTITLYFWPQSLFYLGLFISGATLLGCLGYLGYERIKA